MGELERVCLLVFMADYLLHLWVSPRPRLCPQLFRLDRPLGGAVFFVPQINSGLILWVFKFGRVLRVFKLLRFMDEAQTLGRALRASARRIGVFLFFVVLTQVVLGYLMVVIESSHPNTQFRLWVRGCTGRSYMTTVGYGDFVPQTVLGQLLAAVVMLLGFGIIAIPTGIVTVEAMQQVRRDQRVCAGCGHGDHRRDACTAIVAGLGCLPVLERPKQDQRWIL